MLERNKTRQKTAGSVRTRRTGVPFLYFIAAGILSCAQITGVGSPFGVAFAAAACRTGYGFGAVLGTFAGYLPLSYLQKPPLCRLLAIRCIVLRS